MGGWLEPGLQHMRSLSQGQVGPALLVAPYLAVTVAILQTWAPVPPQLLNLWGMGGACPALHMLDLWDGTPGIRLRSWGEWTYPNPAVGFQQPLMSAV